MNAVYIQCGENGTLLIWDATNTIFFESIHSIVLVCIECVFFYIVRSLSMYAMFSLYSPALFLVFTMHLHWWYSGFISAHNISLRNIGCNKNPRIVGVASVVQMK